MEDEQKLKNFLIKASKDKELRDQFLRDPRSVAERYDAPFTDEQFEKIKETAMFIESLDDLVWWKPDPVWYPIGPILNRWKEQELLNVGISLKEKSQYFR